MIPIRKNSRKDINETSTIEVEMSKCTHNDIYRITKKDG
jgi:hypothetical protein